MHTTRRLRSFTILVDDGCAPIRAGGEEEREEGDNPWETTILAVSFGSPLAPEEGTTSDGQMGETEQWGYGVRGLLRLPYLSAPGLSKPQAGSIYAPRG